MSAHTPGPWRIDKLGPWVEADDRVEGSVADCDVGRWEEAQRIANARLIAAAPDLLAACEFAAAVLSVVRALAKDDPRDRIALDRCAVAIAKARGE